MQHGAKNSAPQPPKSFVAPSVVIKKSQINGVGMFANRPIAEGEVVFIKGGHVVSRQQLYSSKTINSYLPIDDQYFVGAISGSEEDGIKLFINHSCDPNCGLRGEITFVAMRRISKGEELTIDYAMVDDADYTFTCSCKTDHCRKIVTGRDWRLVQLQRRYGVYFARYLQSKFMTISPIFHRAPRRST